MSKEFKIYLYQPFSEKENNNLLSTIIRWTKLTVFDFDIFRHSWFVLVVFFGRFGKLTMPVSLQQTYGQV